MDPRDFQAKVAAHRGAWAAVLGWAESARAFEALGLAVDAGLLDARSGAVDLAAGALPAHTARELGAVLVAAGVVVPGEGGALTVGPAFAPLFSPDAPQPLETLLGRERTLLDALRGTPPSDSARALAVGAGFDPASPLAPAAAHAAVSAIPELRELWTKGARHVELGCGAASLGLACLRIFPGLRIVGVELDAAAGAQAVARARSLGLQDRFELRVGDARHFEDGAPFDSAQWSQQFFPAGARAGTLAAAHRALRPGAYLLAPTFGPAPRLEALSREALGAASMRLAFARLGVEVRSEEEVAAELQAAGFALSRAIPMPPGPYLFSRSLVLARRVP